MDCRILGSAGMGLGLVGMLFLAPAGQAIAANGVFPWKSGDRPPAVRRIAAEDTGKPVLC